MSGNLTLSGYQNPHITLTTSGGSYSYLELLDGTSSGYIIKNQSAATSNGVIAGALYLYTDSSKPTQIVHSGTSNAAFLSGGDVYIRGNVYVVGNGASTGTQVVYNSGSWGINITGTSANITAYTINQNVGTANAPTFAGLTVNTGGAGTWGQFVVNSTSLWGDGATLYTTIGAGGAAGIMIYNPHIVWNAGNSCAGIRLGRSGGTSAGKYYEIGTGASDNFFIAKESLANGAQLNINSSGNATFSGTVTASNLSGTNTGDQTNISGNAATATALSSGQSNWSGTGVLGNVVGMLAWKNYGNSHVIFDASNGTSPSGGGVSQTNATTPWSAAYPTLMGWNGSGTYGVRVDSARISDSTSGNAATVTNGVYTSSSQNNLSGILNFGSSGATPYVNPTGTSNGISFGGIESSSLRTYGIFTEQENVGGNYSKLTINYHTGIRLGASSSYGGTRFYNNFAGGGGGTEIFSVGNGDNHVRVANNLYATGTVTGSNLSGTNTGDQTNISGNAATTSQTTFSTMVVNGQLCVNASNDASTSTGGISFWSTGPVTTSWIGFKNGAWGAYHGGATSTGGYATYHIMDTVSRGWIWKYASPGGTNFSGTNVASIQNDNGAFSTGTRWDGTGSNPIFAQINVCQGLGSATNYRDIDMKGSWAAGEGHSITATHGSTSSDIVGQLTFQHDSPGSRIKLGRLYNSGNQSSYPWQLISDGNTGVSGAWVTLSGGDWSVTRYGPNTTWGAYLYVGAGSNKSGSGAAQILSTDGNLHMDCASNSKQIYMNYYSGGSAIGAYGPINCTYDVTAYSSDKRLKTNIKVIDNAMQKVMTLTGMTYDWNNVGSQYGWNPKNIREAGVFAQEIEAVLPEAVRPAPFDTDADGNSISGEHFLTVKYEKIVPLLIEAIKEQQTQIEELKSQISYLVDNK
jgi:hypothetical protein